MNEMFYEILYKKEEQVKILIPLIKSYIRYFTAIFRLTEISVK